MKTQEKSISAIVNKGAYRPEIDGLRAIAVLSVMFFHLGFGIPQGGFVGVDVFFVISGYLITRFILKEIEAGKFRYSNFLTRRIRRIMPALLFMTMCSVFVSYFILYPEDMGSFSKSVIAQPLALQNIHFLADGEYFLGSDQKPLLHTWSLGVEEQFYLVWPFLIVLITPLNRTAQLTTLLGIIIVSFVLNLILPIVSPKASFFLLPTRAWELGIGGVLSFIEPNLVSGHAMRNTVRRNIIALLSAFVLIFSFIWISKGMLFPGWVAAIPVFATAILIYSLTFGETIVKKFLSTKPIVFIGLISYSLYLWHWPVIAFARHLKFDTQATIPAISILVISLVFAYMSYHYIEHPIRTRKILASNRSLIAAMLSIGSMLIIFGVFSLKTNGLDLRYNGMARSMLTASFNTRDERCGFVYRSLHPNAQVCQLNGIPVKTGNGVLLWGNSHAGMWVDLLSKLADSHGIPFYLNSRNCRATNDHSFCNENVQSKILKFIEKEGIDKVILASSWYGGYNIPDDRFETDLENIVRKLSLLGVDTYLVIDTPSDASFEPLHQYLQNKSNPRFGSIDISQYEEAKHGRELELFHNIMRRFHNIHIIDPISAFCFDGKRCYGGRGENAWYRDSSHITLNGAHEATDLFVPVFNGL
ncbi:MAG: acyltransferase [Gammaproteobacteria bacterium]|nr:acyltransferase [Gammaproteobacteria bacterium]